MNTSPTDIIRVILADDHPIYRDGLRTILQLDPAIQVVGQAANGEELLKALEETEADMVVLDVDMQPMDGLETLCEIKRRGIPVKTIILTLHDDAEILRKSVTEGVNGFLLKDADARDVIEAVHTVYSGRDYLSQPATDLIMQSIRSGSPIQGGSQQLSLLSRAELKVLKRIASEKTSREIADELNLSVRTIENHRARICKKLKLSGSHSLVKFAFEHRDKI